MADSRSTCQGGEFDGHKLATPRDEALCGQGGGVVVAGQPTSDGCMGGSVENFSATRGQALHFNSLRNAAAIFGEREEVALLRRLSAAAVPATDALLSIEPEYIERLSEAGQRIEIIASNLIDPEFDGVLYTEEDHRFFVKIGRELAERTGDDVFPELLETATQVAEQHLNVRALEVRERFGGLPQPPDLDVSDTDLNLTSPLGNLSNLTYDLSPVLMHHHHRLDKLDLMVDVDTITDLMHSARAETAIAAKADQLGALAASPLGEVTPVRGGFVRRYADCDIYYSDTTGAHEVHGEIRRKYSQVNGPTLLGLPTTDETGCPDGKGRFNHFVKSSIYWTPTTGPFYVRNPCRFRWASQSWETGPLGYPVRDEESLSAAYPGGGPTMYWSHFQNGMVFGRGGDAQEALAATATRQQVLDALRTTIDRRMPSFELDTGIFSYTVRGGLHGVDFLGVDDWQYGFYGSVPRTLRIRVNGFVSVPLAPDPTFQIEMGLRFSTRWPIGSFFYPTTKKFVATLIHTRISVQGIASGTIAGMIQKAIWSAFTPGPADPEITDNSMVITSIPTGANQKPGAENLDFLDVMLMADGSLNVFVNPLPAIAGGFRRYFAQNALNSALENL
ncbi:LGFP repeat-containing protein [Lewinella sp. JB7]|uniref:LGFP repeat-containing protein n=1 Tax=Lewinella sp. JB7 TaxID=2962887 RepID=UPI0020C96B39|nr:hypothetical protein [Lewinella sp. JB7]MCP9237715.1 hypothetical protein [Lewinella sp. JB7]